MTDKVNAILQEINNLDPDELDIFYSWMLNKMNRREKAKLILEEYIEKGKGFWKSDAQEYVDELRNEDREVI